MEKRETSMSDTDNDEIDFFQCYKCKKLFPFNQSKEIRLPNLLLPKQICLSCYESINPKPKPKESEMKI